MTFYHLLISSDTAQRLDDWASRRQPTPTRESALWQMLSVTNTLLEDEKAGQSLLLVRPYQHGLPAEAMVVSPSAWLNKLASEPVRPFDATAMLDLSVQHYGYVKALHRQAIARGAPEHISHEQLVERLVQFASVTDSVANGPAGKWQLVKGNPKESADVLQGQLARGEISRRPVEHLTF
jgi:hypothetical protein